MKNCGKWKLGGPDTSPPLLISMNMIHEFHAEGKLNILGALILRCKNPIAQLSPVEV